MIFVPLECQRGRPPATQRVTVQRHGRHTTLCVRVSGDVAERAGLLPGRRVTVHLGVDEDAGLLLIAAGETGSSAVRRPRNSATVEFTMPGKRLGIGAPHTLIEVPFGIRGANLVLDLSSLPKLATEIPYARQDEVAGPLPIG